MGLFRLFCFVFITSAFSLPAEIPRKLAGIGIACIDYIVAVDDSFISTLPVKKGTFLKCDWSTFSEILHDATKREIPLKNTGGSTANTLKGLAQLDVPCALISITGEDSVANWLETTFSSIGIHCLFFSSALPSSQILCLVTPDGERTFCVYPGAESEFSSKEIATVDFSLYKHVHIEGYQFRQSDLVESTIKQAKSQGCTVSFDLCDAALVSTFRERILKNCLRSIDILFANEEEAFALTHLPPHEACSVLGKECPLVIVKIGEKGCIVSSNEEVFHAPGFPVRAVDTTGAGDLFASGFLYGHLNGASLCDCTYYGNLLGSAVVQVKGAEIPLDLWPALKKIMEERSRK